MSVCVYCIYSTAVVSIKTIGWLRILSLLFISSRAQRTKRIHIQNCELNWTKTHIHYHILTHTHSLSKARRRSNTPHHIRHNCCRFRRKRKYLFLFSSFFVFIIVVVVRIVNDEPSLHGNGSNSERKSEWNPLCDLFLCILYESEATKFRKNEKKGRKRHDESIICHSWTENR